jgi:hypothetical protein
MKSSKTKVWTRGCVVASEFMLSLTFVLDYDAVLPKVIRERLVLELDKRLDLDFDSMLESPKLRLKLSPAELDKSLLELYDKLSESPSGDLLRMIGGGGRVGMQNLYMKQRSVHRQRRGAKPDLFPSFLDDASPDDVGETPTQRVRWALRRNLPKKDIGGGVEPDSKANALESNRPTPRMCLSPSSEFSCKVSRPQSVVSGSFHPRRRSMTTSLLI